MDGFTDMAIKLMENILLLVSLLKETLAYLFPPELAEAFELLWKGLIGSSSWAGYAAYSLYAFGLDDGWAMDVCEAFGYGYYVIDGMNYIVAFASPSEDGEGGVGDLLGAATDALGDLGIEVPSEVTDVLNQATEALGDVEGQLQEAVDEAGAEGDAGAGAEADAGATE